MNAERHTSPEEPGIIDRVAMIDNSDLSKRVHRSRLYPFNENALVAVVPDKNTIGTNVVWLMQMKTILKAISAAARISSDHKWLLDDTFQNLKLSDSSKKFYDHLAHLNDEAQSNWCILRVWFRHLQPIHGWSNNLLSYESELDYFDDWSFHAPYYFNEWPADELAEIGLLCDYEYNPDNDEYEPLDIYVDDIHTLNQYFEFEFDDINKVIKWFTDYKDELNYLYGHSVKLINQVAYDAYEHWLVTEVSPEDFDNNSDIAKWPKTPKLEGKQFFSRYFRARFFQEKFPVFKVANSFEVKGRLTQAKNMSSSLQEYTYYLDHLSKTGSSALLSRKEVKKWQEWYANRKKWHDAYVKVSDWFYSHEDIPTAEEMESEYIKMVELQDKVKIKRDDLDLLKADWHVLSKVGPKKMPANEAETINKIWDAIEDFKPHLDKYGLEVKVQKKQNYDQDVASRNSIELLEKYWKSSRQIGIKKPDHSFGSLTEASRLEAKLRDFIGTPQYDAWYEVLNDGEGRCNRHSIGYQKVTKAGAKDSAYRNAGMRFVESNNLEPVANFDEVTIEKALADQVRHNCKLKGMTEGKINSITRRLSGMSRDDLIQAFRYSLQDAGYESSAIDTFLGQAFEQEGKKIITKKTLYDARQVAGLLAYEQNKNPKLQPKELPKPKAPGKPKVVVL